MLSIILLNVDFVLSDDNIKLIFFDFDCEIIIMILLGFKWLSWASVIKLSLSDGYIVNIIFTFVAITLSLS